MPEMSLTDMTDAMRALQRRQPVTLAEWDSIFALSVELAELWALMEWSGVVPTQMSPDSWLLDAGEKLSIEQFDRIRRLADQTRWPTALYAMRSMRTILAEVLQGANNVPPEIAHILWPEPSAEEGT